MPKHPNQNSFIKVLAEQAAIETSREVITKMLGQLNEGINQLKVEELQLKAAILNEQTPISRASDSNLLDRGAGIPVGAESSTLNTGHVSTYNGEISSVLSNFSHLKPVQEVNINSINTQPLDLDVKYKCVFDEQETDSDSE